MFQRLKRFLWRFLPVPARTFHKRMEEQNKIIKELINCNKELSNKFGLLERMCVEPKCMFSAELKMINEKINDFQVQSVNMSKRVLKSILTCESMIDGMYEFGVIPKRFCPSCSNEVRAYLPAPLPNDDFKKDVWCPHCSSYHRHRALSLYLETKTDLFKNDNESDIIKLLHFAPERAFHDKFSKISNIDYYPVDFNPSKWGIRNIVDIQHIQYPNDMFDVIICIHVLEHIPDDNKAMKELLRVLKKDGIAYICAPIFNIEKT